MTPFSFEDKNTRIYDMFVNKNTEAIEYLKN